jgi:hypothetical protein
MKPQVSLGNTESNHIAGIVGYLSRLFGKKTRKSFNALEQESFEEDARQQFVKLKQKGLSIPVFTL